MKRKWLDYDGNFYNNNKKENKNMWEITIIIKLKFKKTRFLSIFRYFKVVNT
jgi:hypothetical protein